MEKIMIGWQMSTRWTDPPLMLMGIIPYGTHFLLCDSHTTQQTGRQADTQTHRHTHTDTQRHTDTHRHTQTHTQTQMDTSKALFG